MSNILGVSAGFHDAALSVVNRAGEIVFASHSERFSRNKHDPHLCDEIINEAMSYGEIDTIAYYERPWLKKLRGIRAGQLDFSPWTLRGVLNKEMYHYPHLRKRNLKMYNHHLSHAAGGFQTSPFNDATVVVIDAIGEFDTISIWNAWYDDYGIAQYKLRARQKYPHSIGMFYSAMTKRLGLRPMDEEYILMGMAAYGRPSDYVKDILKEYVDTVDFPPVFKENLHIGIPDYFLKHANDFDLARASQEVVEALIDNVIARSKHFIESNNLVYAGGVALNCLANRDIGKHYDNIWIMPNPGDAGSSLGAAALAYGRQLLWKDAFLGYNIEGEYPVKQILDELVMNKIVGVANGRAEFGPRAFGNRSLLADPRGDEIKDAVNDIKRRQKFRPFAPVILEEHVNDYFRMPRGFKESRYMQVVAECRKPKEFPAIVHKDGTSRVQTVPNDGSGIRKLLEAWKVYTGCPMLLNTSLNIRGEPMVNTVADAAAFEKEYGVKVCTNV